MRRAAGLLLVSAVSAFAAPVARASVVAVMPHYPYILVPYIPLNTDPGDVNGPVLEQDVVFQCDPAWGPDECPIEGIDFRNVEASVLLQNYPELGFMARSLMQPGMRPSPSVCPLPGQIGRCPGGVFYPSNQFQSELAALSWNFVMTLVAMGEPYDPGNPALDELDPAQPMSTAPGQCSYVQPQYCASVIELLPEPGTTLTGLAALLALAALPHRRQA